jgi:hypothetical protein
VIEVVEEGTKTSSPDFMESERNSFRKRQNKTMYGTAVVLKQGIYNIVSGHRRKNRIPAANKEKCDERDGSTGRRFTLILCCYGVRNVIHSHCFVRNKTRLLM